MTPQLDQASVSRMSSDEAAWQPVSAVLCVAKRLMDDPPCSVRLETLPVNCLCCLSNRAVVLPAELSLTPIMVVTVLTTGWTTYRLEPSKIAPSILSQATSVHSMRELMARCSCAQDAGRSGSIIIRLHAACKQPRQQTSEKKHYA